MTAAGAWIAFSFPASVRAADEVRSDLFLGSVPWDQLFDEQGGSNVFFGIDILGSDPFARNLSEHFMPASNTKLFTSAAVLSRLGGDARIPTVLRWTTLDPSDPGVIADVNLIGYGDPTWGMSEFGETFTTRVDTIADALVAQGVHEIHGEIRVVSADPRWDVLRFPEGWQTEDQGECYAALAQSFNLNINCATYRIQSLTRGQWIDPGVPVPVKLLLSAGASTDLHFSTEDGPEGLGKTYVISGTLRASKAVDLVLPVNDVRGWVKNLLEQAIARRGILYHPDEAVAAVGDGVAHKEAVFYSPKLSEILKPFMKKSLNLVGDALFKILGSNLGHASAPDLVAAGQGVLNDFVGQLGPDQDDGAVFYDGAGLSHLDQVSPLGMTTLLEALLKRQDFPVIWDALPIAGVDGTLESRMRGTAAQGVLRAKTGTLHGVYNLSGYVPRYQPGSSHSVVTEYVPFVMLTRTTSAFGATARAAEDRAGAALAKQVNPEP